MPAYAYDLMRVYRVQIASGVALYALAELVWLRLRHGRAHEPRELLANVFIYAIDTALRLGTWPVRFALFTLIYAASELRIQTTLASACLCYLGVDLILYFWHRVLHETELGWA